MIKKKITGVVMAAGFLGAAALATQHMREHRVTGVVSAVVNYPELRIEKVVVNTRKGSKAVTIHDTSPHYKKVRVGSTYEFHTRGAPQDSSLMPKLAHYIPGLRRMYPEEYVISVRPAQVDAI
jgi:hypothetical protein